jgi:hypothetical protein
MPASVIGAVKIGLNKQPNPNWNSYVVLVGSGLAAQQSVTIERSPLKWTGEVTLTDGTLALVRVKRVINAVEREFAVPLALPVGPETCTVTVDNGTPAPAVIDLYDA